MPQSESTNKAVYIKEILEHFGVSRYVFKKIIASNPRLKTLNQKYKRFYSPIEFDEIKTHFWNIEKVENV